MSYSTCNLIPLDPTDRAINRNWRRPDDESAHPRRATRPPSGIATAGLLTDLFRAYLADRGLGDWHIFFCQGVDLGDVERHLAAVGEGDARWEAHPHDALGGEQPGALVRDPPYHIDNTALYPAGFLWLKAHQVVLARWHYYNVPMRHWLPIYLSAAPSQAYYTRLRDELEAVRRAGSRNTWQVIGTEGWEDHKILRGEGDNWDSLVMRPDVRRRLEAEVVRFFQEPVARMYRELNIPYRRGLLLYGPPGNGKTSLIRVIGSLNPDIQGLLLTGEDFNDHELAGVIRRWCELAPAILVIEDLDWLFHAAHLNVSTFLNMIDGVDRRDGGLLLIATTNHPEALDPAINNRPGRFDVAIEVSAPDADMRAQFFRRGKIGQFPGELREKLVTVTEGLSFCHLREVESLSGLHAIQDGRSVRTDEDVCRAAELVKRGYEEASKGFPGAVTPFGLGKQRG